MAVEVPATSANLGPGFDSLGLALDLTDRIEARFTDGLRRDRRGGRRGRRARAHRRHQPRGPHRAHRAGDVRRVRRARPARPGPPLRQRRSAEPRHGVLGRGDRRRAGGRRAPGRRRRLGLRRRDGRARHPTGGPPGQRGAPACSAGPRSPGCRPAEVGPVGRATRFDVHPGIAPVLVIPAVEASTAKARGALPATVPHADAAFNVGALGPARPRAVHRARPAARGDRRPTAPAASAARSTREHGARRDAAVPADPGGDLRCGSGGDRLRRSTATGTRSRPGSSTWSAIPRACCRCRCPSAASAPSRHGSTRRASPANAISRHLSSGCYRVSWISTAPRTGWRTGTEYRTSLLTPEASPSPSRSTSTDTCHARRAAVQAIHLTQGNT